MKTDDRVYLKHGNECGQVKLNCELTYCVFIYGFFKKPDGGLTSLQMELFEQSTKKISLLGKRHSEPSVEEPAVKILFQEKRHSEPSIEEPAVKSLFQANNYAPNPFGVEVNDDLW